MDLGWGRKDSVYVVKVKRGEKRIPMPTARMTLQSGDRVYVIGDRQSLEIFSKTLGIRETIHIRTLRDFLDGAYPDREHALACAAIPVRGMEHFVGKPIKKSGITARTNCMILGLERGGYAYKMPDANMLIEEGDILWIIGAYNDLERIASHLVGKAGTHSETLRLNAAEIRERM
jgi:CPA2 family monovalent cation:H+ antiporter-2